MKYIIVLKLLTALNSTLDGALVTLATLVNIVIFYYTSNDETTTYLTSRSIILSVGLFIVLSETMGLSSSKAIGDLSKINVALRLTQEFLLENVGYESRICNPTIQKKRNSSKTKKSKINSDQNTAIDIKNLKFSYKHIDNGNYDLDIKSLTVKKGKHINDIYLDLKKH